MDINADIKRTKKKKEETPELKTIFTLDCKVEEVVNNDEAEEYKFSGKVKADKMDSDLMASIFANLIKQSVPEQAIEEVLNLTAEKLGFTDEDCDCDCCQPHHTSREDFFEFIRQAIRG